MGLSRVLCADSGRFTGLILSKKLKSMNCEVDYVNTGGAAIENGVLKDYDLIFLNLEMPNVNGYEVAKEIRQHHSQVPIIVYSSYPQDEINMRNFTAYLQKPFQDKDLDELIAMYLQV